MPGKVLFPAEGEGRNAVHAAMLGWEVHAFDIRSARVGYHRKEKNFIAGMGFVPRSNINETYGSIEPGPRPGVPGIMQILTGGNFNYISNIEQGFTETREIQLKPLGTRFFSGEEVSYILSNQFEHLLNDFRISGSVVIPRSEYEWWRNKISLKTKGALNIWGETTYGYGNFFNGKREDITIKAVGYLQNHVDLPQGSFTANIYQLNASILFSPDITLYNYIQYDNFSRTAGWQSRFQWILKPGNEVIIAWNSLFAGQNNTFHMEENALRLKLKYNIRF